jgi:hypothetical protein
MPNRYELSTVTLPLFPGGYQGALMLYNEGPGNVYVSDSPSLNAATGWPVAKGTTVSWAPNRALYACSDTTATLAADANVGSMTSAVDVANALIGSGLASDIADAISIKGVPSIDEPALLFTKTGSFLSTSSGWNLGLDTSTWIDISKYNSIYVHTVANAQAVPGSADTFVTSAWMMPGVNVSPATTLAIESCDCALTQEPNDGNGSWSHLSLPAQGSGLYLYVAPNADSTLPSYTVNFTTTVYGSFRSVPNAKLYAQNQHLIGAGSGRNPVLDSPTIPGMDSMHYSFNINVAANTGVSTSLSYINAPYELSFAGTTSTAPVNGSDIYISDGYPNRQIVGNYGDMTKTGQIVRWPGLLCGGRVPRLWINNHDTFAKGYNFAVTFVR